MRAVFRPDQHIADPGLPEFDARYEVTQYPADLLWGPGSVTDAAAWYAEHQPEPDECDYLDRTFLIRHDGADLHLPMRPSVAASQPEADQYGKWYAIKADRPTDAYHHVRNLITGVGCARRGQCPRARSPLGQPRRGASKYGRPGDVLLASAPSPPLPRLLRGAQDCRCTPMHVAGLGAAEGIGLRGERLIEPAWWIEGDTDAGECRRKDGAWDGSTHVGCVR